MTSQITVVFSRHESEGNCNPDTLYQIIERVNPEVIFEELCENNFERAYSEHSLNTLETTAIGMYLLTHPVTHIPVDTFERPYNFDEKIRSMYNQFFHRAGESSSNLKIFMDQMVANIGHYGFHLLNSGANEQLNEKRDELIASVLAELNDEKLLELRNLEMNVNDRREETILDNIYRYSVENNYERGLLLIGSAHRKSILEKIAQRCKTEKNGINWELFQF